MSVPPLSAQDIRAAAEVHRELGPEYSDAVVDSFFAKIDKEIEARIDARLARTRTRPLPDKPHDRGRDVLAGIAIGGVVTGLPLILAGWDPFQPFVGGVLLVWTVILVAYLGFRVVAVLARKPDDRD